MGLIKSGKWWWGYLHENGEVHIMRYSNDKIIANYERLPMIKGIFDPFEAFDSTDAKKQCLAKLKEVQENDRKKN